MSVIEALLVALPGATDTCYKCSLGIMTMITQRTHMFSYLLTGFTSAIFQSIFSIVTTPHS